jgi:hypothetical protein
MKITKADRELWSALNQYISQNGGWLVSIPFVFPATVEVLPGTLLQEKLAQNHQQVGTRSRMTSNGPVEVERYSLNRPPKP